MFEAFCQLLWKGRIFWKLFFLNFFLCGAPLYESFYSWSFFLEVVNLFEYFIDCAWNDFLIICISIFRLLRWTKSRVILHGLIIFICIYNRLRIAFISFLQLHLPCFLLFRRLFFFLLFEKIKLLLRYFYNFDEIGSRCWVVVERGAAREFVKNRRYWVILWSLLDVLLEWHFVSLNIQLI